MVDVVSKTRASTPTRPTSPQNGKDTRPPQKEWLGRGQLDDEIRRDI